MPWRILARMPFTYLPYQWLIGFSALRATRRLLLGRGDWEKTEHLGAHRPAIPVPLTLPADNGARPAFSGGDTTRYARVGSGHYRQWAATVAAAPVTAAVLTFLLGVIGWKGLTRWR